VGDKLDGITMQHIQLIQLLRHWSSRALLMAFVDSECETFFYVTDILVAYISRGLLSSIMEPKDVLSAIGVESQHTLHRVVINTYAVVDG
jgi:hypothetical protein